MDRIDLHVEVRGADSPTATVLLAHGYVQSSVLWAGQEIFVTASIGITVSDREGSTTSEMLRDADAAMYRAKARGRDCVEVFAPGSHDASVLTLRTTNELRRGIESIPEQEYFALGYYERWLRSIALLTQQLSTLLTDTVEHIASRARHEPGQDRAAGRSGDHRWPITASRPRHRRLRWPSACVRTRWPR